MKKTLAWGHCKAKEPCRRGQERQQQEESQGATGTHDFADLE